MTAAPPAPSRRHRSDRPRSIASLVLMPALGLIVVLMVAGLGGFAWNEHRQTTREAGVLLQQLARTATADTNMRDALVLIDATPDGPTRTFIVQQVSAAVQTSADAVRNGTGVDLVLITLPDGTLLSHPTPTRIGTVHPGLLEAAAAEGAAVTVDDPELGPSLMSVVPILVDDRVVGLVGIGFSDTTIGSRFQSRLWPLLSIGALAIGLGLVMVIVIGMWLRRKTLGLDAKALARTVTFYDAGLDVGREGVVIVDPDGRLVVVNRPATLMLGWSGPPAEGTPAGELGLPTELVQVMTGADSVEGLPVLVGERVLVVTRRPAVRGTRDLGSVVTLEDHTELYSLADEVDQLEGFAWSLRMQAHETANRLHTVVSLIELGESNRAIELATAGLRSAQVLADRMVDGVGDPALAALLLGKSAQATERGIDLRLGEIRVRDGLLRPLDLVTIVGNLLDNAMDAVTVGTADRWVRVDAIADEARLTLTVTDSGPGVAAADVERVFEQGLSTKGPAGTRGLGLPLVRQTARQRGGTVRTRPGPGGWFEVDIPVSQGER